MFKIRGLVPVLLGLFAIAYSLQQNTKSTANDQETRIVVQPDHVGSLPVCDVVRGSIYDGDTIRVNCGSGETKVRFACIDAPEVKPRQEYGIESRDYLREILANGEMKVKVDALKTDKYGRTVAELWVNERHGWELLQSLQAGGGTVWAYEQYKADCKNWDAVSGVASRAKAQKLGIWRSLNPTPPWEFRRSTRG